MEDSKKIKDATLINIDCMKYMRSLPYKHFDLAIVDPPYFKGPDNSGYYGNKVSSTNVVRNEYKKIDSWHIPGNEYFVELLRTSKNQIIWGYNYYKIMNIGEGRIIWDKVNDSSTFSDGEVAYCSLIKTVKFFRFMWNGMIQGDMKNKEERIHPTQKPVKLYEWLLTNYAKDGQKIFDSHMGSGSSAIACNNLGYEFVGCELDSDYYNAACKRIEEHTKQERLF